MNLRDTLNETISRLERQSGLAERFLRAPTGTKRFAIGKNNDTRRVQQLVHLDGVIDDYEHTAPTWEGIPVVATADVPRDALIVNCSTSISPVTVRRHLDASGLHAVVGLHELIVASRGALPWPAFVRSQRTELEEYADAWSEMLNSLDDQQSKQTLLDVLRFRLSADPAYMTNYEVRLQDQYFEDFMGFSNEVFVDAGGYDGDTSEEFAKRYPDYAKIFFFEPSEKNMASARRRLSKLRDIEFHSIGLSDVAGSLNFDQDAGSAASVTPLGKTRIQVDALDALINDPVTFIKMDLEGWELKALQGARSHISRYRPKLAIAVYHDAPDFRKIYQFVREFGHDYKVFVRHYTQGWSETVMFFV